MSNERSHYNLASRQPVAFVSFASTFKPQTTQYFDPVLLLQRQARTGLDTITQSSYHVQVWCTIVPTQKPCMYLLLTIAYNIQSTNGILVVEVPACNMRPDLLTAPKRCLYIKCLPMDFYSSAIKS